MDHREGRAGKASKLHSIRRRGRQEKAEKKEADVYNKFSSVSGEDYWTEKGELGRWVRVHVRPRLSLFSPGHAQHGPGRKTKLIVRRETRGVHECGRRFRKDDDWTTSRESQLGLVKPWTGKTVFIVDQEYSKQYGTDQRRQRIDAEGKSISWADME